MTEKDPLDCIDKITWNISFEDTEDCYVESPNMSYEWLKDVDTSNWI